MLVITESRLVVLEKHVRYVIVPNVAVYGEFHTYEIDPLTGKCQPFVCDGFTHAFKVIGGIPHCSQLLVIPFQAAWVALPGGLLSPVYLKSHAQHHYHNLSPTEKLLFDQYVPDFT